MYAYIIPYVCVVSFVLIGFSEDNKSGSCSAARAFNKDQKKLYGFRWWPVGGADQAALPGGVPWRPAKIKDKPPAVFPV
jgi:hypothetical protein